MTAWQNQPFAISVEAGEKKAFCLCGQSKNGPFCDGSHAGSGLTPGVVTFEESKTVYACGCQKSGGRPWCDGSHAKS